MLEKIFGPKALKIEHVGSTALGIKAKPVLDVLVLLTRIEDLAESEIEAMQKLGYEYEANYIAPRTAVFIKKDSSEKRLENIHIAEEGSDGEKQFIWMRDYFRAHPEKVKEYVELKEKLNKEFPDDYSAYRLGKNEFLQNILKESTDWRKGQF